MIKLDILQNGTEKTTKKVICEDASEHKNKITGMQWKGSQDNKDIIELEDLCKSIIFNMIAGTVKQISQEDIEKLDQKLMISKQYQNYKFYS